MLEAHEQTDRGVLRGVRKQSQRASVSVSVCVCAGGGGGGRYCTGPPALAARQGIP